MPGARLDFSCAARAEIGRALAHLPAGDQFLSSVATACHLGNPVKFGAVETLIRHGLLAPNLIIDGNTMLQTVCLHGQNAWTWVENSLTLEQRLTSLLALGARIDHPALPAIDLLQQTWERDDADGHLAAAALIANGCDPLQRDEQHRTLLHRAAGTGNIPVLRGWQRAGLAMDLTAGDQGNTALHIAASNGQHEALRFLITEGTVAINTLNLESETALHLAVLHSHIEAARALLELQASPDFTDRNGLTPLFIADFQRSAPLRALLVQHGADPRAHDSRPSRNRNADDWYQHFHGHPWPDAN